MGCGQEITAANGCCCVGVILFTCICGFPMIIAGVVLITLFDETVAGISILSVASLLILGGFILMTLMCAGVIGQRGYTAKKGFFNSQSTQRSFSDGRRSKSPTGHPVTCQAVSPPPGAAYGHPPSYNPMPPMTQVYREPPKDHGQLYRTVPTIEPSAPPLET